MEMSVQSVAQIDSGWLFGGGGYAPEKRLWFAVLKTFVDDALKVRRVLDACLESGEEIPFHTRRTMAELRSIVKSKYIEAICSLSDTCHRKFEVTINMIIDGMH